MFEAKPGTYGTPMAHEWTAVRKEAIKKNIVPPYHSLFDTVNFTQLGNSTDFYGPVRQVLRELGESLGNNTPDAIVKQILHPARITRAVLNRKANLDARGKNTRGAVEVVQAAVQLGLSTYRQSSSTPESLTTFINTATKVWGDNILGTKVRQKKDVVTNEATTSDRSRITAGRLADREMGDVLFIALGHGGVSAGMDVYLRYCAKTGSANSDFYPVRFSRLKLNDEAPQVTLEELEHLRMLAEGKSVVVFDEDASSGTTLSLAKLFFETMIAGRPVVTETNMDRRNPSAIKSNKYDDMYLDFQMPEKLIPKEILQFSGKIPVFEPSKDLKMSDFEPKYIMPGNKENLSNSLTLPIYKNFI